MKTPTALVTGAAILAAGLVAAGSVTYAVTGKSLILGHANSASKLTTLSRSGPGPALELDSNASSPPFAVTSKRKVARLNADQVDGLGGRTLQTRAYTFRLPAVSDSQGTKFSLPKLPKATYLVSFTVVATMSTTDATINCYLTDKDEDYRVLSYGGVHAPLFSSSSGSGIVNTAARGPFAFVCSPETGTFSLDGSAHHASVTFVKLDHVTRGVSAAKPLSKRERPRVPPPSWR